MRSCFGKNNACTFATLRKTNNIFLLLLTLLLSLSSLKKIPSGSPGQEDLLAGQVTVQVYIKRLLAQWERF